MILPHCDGIHLWPQSHRAQSSPHSAAPPPTVRRSPPTIWKQGVFKAAVMAFSRHRSPPPPANPPLTAACRSAMKATTMKSVTSEVHGTSEETSEATTFNG
ncbi:hypothetical protein OROMI_022448 [Orobanche minor]